MPDAVNGLVTVVTGVLVGLIIETMLRAFVDSGLINPLYMVIYQLLSIVAIIGLIHTTKYWGTLYLFGWWFGLWITYSAGIVGIFELIIDSVILGSVLVTRLLRPFSDNYD
jgi:hypothetical protein